MNEPSPSKSVRGTDGAEDQIIPFEPLLIRVRHDGCTGERIAIFLEVLADTGLVVAAYRAAGMSKQAAYDLRNRDPIVAAARRRPRRACSSPTAATHLLPDRQFSPVMTPPPAGRRPCAP